MWKTSHIPRAVGQPLLLLGSPTNLGGLTPKLEAFSSFYPPVSTESIYEEHSHPLHNKVNIVTLAKQPLDDSLQQVEGLNACGFEETFTSK